jgi:hypothetical protein
MLAIQEEVIDDLRSVLGFLSPPSITYGLEMSSGPLLSNNAKPIACGKL